MLQSQPGFENYMIYTYVCMYECMYGMVWYGMLCYSMVWYGMEWNGMARNGTERNGM